MRSFIFYKGLLLDIAKYLFAGILPAAFFVFSAAPLSAQMPDWKMIRDKDGNKYFVDKNWKIYCSGKPEFNYKPVSVEGIDFYYYQALELIKSHYKTDGLYLLKSIMTLPPEIGRAAEMQQLASAEINNFIKKEGDRFEEMNEAASILLSVNQGVVLLTNDKMRYALAVPGSITVMHKKIRKLNRYYYYGLLAGVNFNQKEIQKDDKRAFDVLIAMDSEIFVHPVKTVGKLELNWRNNLGSDTFSRLKAEKDDLKIIYSFSDSKPPYYSGYEGFYLRGNYGYCLRILSTGNIFNSQKDKMMEIIKRLKI